MAKVLVFTKHALSVMLERQIESEWVQRAATAPQWQEPDQVDQT